MAGVHGGTAVSNVGGAVFRAPWTPARFIYFYSLEHTAKRQDVDGQRQWQWHTSTHSGPQWAAGERKRTTWKLVSRVA